jgi:hypothetical protein
MIEAAAGKNVEITGGYSVPGFGIHEMGTARMCNDPKTSVLNKFGQTHDVKNLFVTGGAAFVSSSCQNPALTMRAITVRACEYALDRRVRENRVFCEIHPFDLPVEEIRRRRPIGLILSGGPQSVYEQGAAGAGRELFELGVPTLGICYGMR